MAFQECPFILFLFGGSGGIPTGETLLFEHKTTTRPELVVSMVVYFQVVWKRSSFFRESLRSKDQQGCVTKGHTAKGRMLKTMTMNRHTGMPQFFQMGIALHTVCQWSQKCTDF